MSYLRQGAPFERCTKHQCGVFHLPRMQGKAYRWQVSAICGAAEAYRFFG